MTLPSFPLWRKTALYAAVLLLLALLAGCGPSSGPSSGAASGSGAGSSSAVAAASPTPTKQAAKATPTPTRKATPTPARKATATPAQAAAKPPPKQVDGLPVIYVDQLPPEARDTLRLIDQGGPFPYSKDGVVFENREGILPRKPKGYYHEYTVVTPGSSDRGARRIVTGERGEQYYTDDHYDSFKRIMER